MLLGNFRPELTALFIPTLDGNTYFQCEGTAFFWAFPGEPMSQGPCLLSTPNLTAPLGQNYGLCSLNQVFPTTSGGETFNSYVEGLSLALSQQWQDLEEFH